MGTANTLNFLFRNSYELPAGDLERVLRVYTGQNTRFDLVLWPNQMRTVRKLGINIAFRPTNTGTCSLHSHSAIEIVQAT